MAGPNFPAAAADGGGSSAVWINPAAVEAADGAYATVRPQADADSNWLQTSGYGFAVSGTVTKVLVEALCHGVAVDQHGVQYELELFCQLSNVASGTTRSQGQVPFAVDGWVQFEFDGFSFPAASINAAAFGAEIIAGNVATGSDGTLYLDAVRITVWTAGGSGGGSGAPQVVGVRRTLGTPLLIQEAN